MTKRPLYDHKGKKLRMAQLIEATGHNRNTLYQRYGRGDRDDYLARPLDYRQKRAASAATLAKRKRAIERLTLIPHLPSGVVPVKQWGWFPDAERRHETQQGATP